MLSKTFNILRLLKSQRRLHHIHKQIMAKSSFEYVRNYEEDPKCSLNNWIVVRIDGRSFHKFTETHKFEKPNDDRSLGLMNKAATRVMDNFTEICLAYGQSDEYSFVFRKDAEVFNRRQMKIISVVCSEFTGAYIFHWNEFFPSTPLQYPPAFDARIVLYPTNRAIRDYLSWRQADCHINNLYNTAFWSLVLKGHCTRKEAQDKLSGTLSSDKNEILFSQFGINYNNESPLYRKGTILVRNKRPSSEKEGKKKSGCKDKNSLIESSHVDLIKMEFWEKHSHILEPFIES